LLLGSGDFSFQRVGVWAAGHGNRHNAFKALAVVLPTQELLGPEVCTNRARRKNCTKIRYQNTILFSQAIALHIQQQSATTTHWVLSVERQIGW
jgi:hypothetical protein